MKIMMNKSTCHQLRIEVMDLFPSDKLGYIQREGKKYIGILFVLLFPGYILLQALLKNVVFVAAPQFTAVTGWHLFGVILFLSFSLGTAYSFARYKFPGSELLFYMLLAAMMFANVVVMMPLFGAFYRMTFLNSVALLIFFTVANGQTMCIYLLKKSIENIPEEIFDMGMIDGATDIGILWHVALPISAPLVLTMAILAFIGAWSDFSMSAFTI